MASTGKKRLFRILKWVVSILVILLGITLSLPFIFEDEVKNIAIEEINRHVEADIQVDEIKLSFIKRFPEASLQFKGIKINQAPGFPDSIPLIAAQNILIKFSLMDILNKNYAFQNIEFVDVDFNPSINAKGDVNYNIFYPQENKEDSTHLFVDLKKVKFNDVRIRFMNALTKQDIQLEVNDLLASASLNDQGMSFDVNTAMQVNKVEEDGIVLINNKRISTNIKGSYLLDNEKLTIESSEVHYETIALLLSGSVSTQEDQSSLDIHLQLAQVELQELLKELPNEQQKMLSAYQLHGQLITKAHIAGIVDKHHLPSIQLDFDLNNGQLSLEEQNVKLEKVKLKGHFSNGKRRSVATASVVLDEFSFETQAGYFNGNIRMDNLKDPKIALNAKSKLNLEAVQAIFPLPNVDSILGQIDLDIESKISLSNWQNAETRKFDIKKLKGNAKLKDGRLRLTDDQRTYDKINAAFQFKRDAIRIEDLQLVLNQEPVSLNGSIRNLDAFLSSASNESLVINANLQTPHLDFDKLMPSSENDEPSDGNLPSDYEVHLKFQVGELIWNPYVAQNVSGTLHLVDGDLEINPLRLDALEGSFDGSLKYLCSNPDINFLQTKGKITNMNVSKIFKTFNNFEQEVITDQKITGKISSTFDMHIYETKQGEWKTESLSCNAKISIDDGSLKDVQELNALKSYTRIDDFSNIQFSRLENEIQINNSQILIPEMDIRSDKMNIQVFGKHSFSNAYEYHFKIKLQEILARNVSETQRSEFGEIESDNSGGMTIFLLMKGQGEDFSVCLDRAKASDKIKEDIHQEGEEVKEVLKTEFGPKDTPKSKERQEKRRKKKEEKELIKQQEEGKTIIEWDEF
jgi:hypothetical protein